jgi:putative tryptophan/tyrosine transport system substrate-binding protein
MKKLIWLGLAAWLAGMLAACGMKPDADRAPTLDELKNSSFIAPFAPDDLVTANSGSNNGKTTPPGTPAVTEGVKSVDWMGLLDEAADEWVIVPNAADKFRIEVKLKQRSLSDPYKKVMVIISRTVRDTFDPGLSIILTKFLNRGIAADFTVINYQDKNENAAKALEIAQNEKFDLIFSMGSVATAYVHDNFRGKSIPVVTVLAKDPVPLGQMPAYEATSGTNIAYTSVNARLDLQMNYLLQLLPELKNIAIMYERSNQSARETQVEPLRAEAGKRGIGVYDVVVENTANNVAELRDKVPLFVQQMKGSDPTLKNSIFWITGSSYVYRETKLITQLSAEAPVLSVFPDVIKDGAAVSIGVSFATNSQFASVYAADILQGKVKPGDLPVGVISPPDIAINFQAVKKYGLKIPFSFFESASTIYDYDGNLVRKDGNAVAKN